MSGGSFQSCKSSGLLPNRNWFCSKVKRHRAFTESQLRVWVHGDAFVPLGHIMNVGWFFSELQEFWVVAKQKLVLFKGEASPCFYRHFESQLRVWVHGDAFVPLGHIMNVGWFFSELQEVLGCCQTEIGFVQR